MKKKLSCVIALSLALSFSIVKIKAEDFAGNESYYDSLCSGQITDSETKQTCRAYQLYLNQKALDRMDELAQIQKDLENIKKNIAENVRKIKQYEAQIAESEKQIRALEQSIIAAEENIRKLEVEIVERENKIDEIDGMIQERMVSMQSFVRVNNYIDFFVGATSFLDLIRRLEALSDIEKSDRDLMDQLETEIIALNNDKDELNRQKQALYDNKANVEANKRYVEGLKKVIEQVLIEFYQQEADLEAQENQIAADYQASINQLKEISEAIGNILPSPGWTKPVSGGVVTASTWYYPASFGGGGGVHLGIDIAKSVGTDIKAVANGVVIHNANACNTYGYLTNTCGPPGSWGGGNQVYLLISVASKTYAIKYLHLKKDTPIAKGTIVNAGDKIGEIGSSGNSSGPHVHIEIFYLGTNDINHYISEWRGDMSFGAGWGSEALDKTCDKTGGRAPCRLAPKSLLGY